MKQAATAATLALTGDTIAQLREKWVNNKALQTHLPNDDSNQNVTWSLLDHNWLRALRMASYGFLLYGPGSYVWYQYLDRLMPQQTPQNVLIKVVLNQIILGPCVIAVVFAWNNLWQGKLSELPNKYQKDALRTLLFGFRFWIPVSVINFWAIPLQARVAFMSMNSIFWNFYLSSTMSK
ncbi:peroxisomal membrane 22 kDa (Mpv17/PMP22) family protein [Artemisia annua]|nr:peroxisomal membrane 22 kDa (Mpv17/PMP22) family protein [Artemisia annua]